MTTRVTTAHPSCATLDAPWRDQIEWWTDPRLAYAAGLADGISIGREQVNAELVAALARALGGPDCVDYRDGVTRHLRAVNQKARRERADRGELAA